MEVDVLTESRVYQAAVLVVNGWKYNEFAYSEYLPLYDSATRRWFKEGVTQSLECYRRGTSSWESKVIEYEYFSLSEAFRAQSAE